MSYLSEDFDSFILKVAENESSYTGNFLKDLLTTKRSNNMKKTA